MNKLYITILLCAAAVINTSASGNVLLPTDIHRSSPVKTGDEFPSRLVQVASAVAPQPSASLKDDQPASIAGDYVITIGNYYYGQVSDVDYDCTLTEADGKVTLTCSQFRSPVTASYDASTGTLAFSQFYIGPTTIDESNPTVYYEKFVPFVYNPDTEGTFVVPTDFSAKVDAAAGTIVFEKNHGFSWCAYKDEACSALYGYLELFDIVGMVRGTMADIENEGWTSLGNARFMDGWVLPACGYDQTKPENQYDVELQQNNDNKNVYRLVDPYKGNSPVASINLSNTRGYIQFDVTDPDHVVFEVLEAGFATDRLLPSMGGLQKLYCYNMLTLFSRLYGAEPSQIIQEMGATLNYTTFKDGVVRLGNMIKAGDLENDACVGIQGMMIYGAQWSDSEGKTRDMSATITFPEAGSGVENVVSDADGAPAEFYDLHGRRVARPAPGSLVIRRCGASVGKVIVR